MRWVVLAVVVVACKGSGGDRAPPPPPPAFPLVGPSEAVIPLANIDRPSAVVWISAAGGIEHAPAPKVWDGRLPSVGRAPVASLDVLATIARPASTEPPIVYALPEGGPDPEAGARRRAAAARNLAERFGTRGFERAPAARGSRVPDEPRTLVMASPAVPAVTVIKLLTRIGGQLGVLQKGDQLGALRTWYEAAEVGYVAGDDRQAWIELHLDASGIDVLALPSNGHTLVPWTKDSVDAPALRAIYQTLGKETPKLDVFVSPDVPYQRLIDTLVALDGLGVAVPGLGESPGPVDGRLAAVIKLRNARASFSTATAVLELGQPSAQGDLEKSEIKRVFRGQLATLTACYDAQLAKDPGLRGTVTVQFFVAPTGVVIASAANGMDPVVASCVATALKTFAFPKPKGGGGVQVNYPLRFRPKDA
ncbi:hypothetical protein BH11MYX3_BH11MYX3_24530 [soil metagenome]